MEPVKARPDASKSAAIGGGAGTHGLGSIQLGLCLKLGASADRFLAVSGTICAAPCADGFAVSQRRVRSLWHAYAAHQFRAGTNRRPFLRDGRSTPGLGLQAEDY